METGRAEKTSFAVSLLVHAALIAVVLTVGNVVLQAPENVFFVELLKDKPDVSSPQEERTTRASADKKTSLPASVAVFRREVNRTGAASVKTSKPTSARADAPAVSVEISGAPTPAAGEPRTGVSMIAAPTLGGLNPVDTSALDSKGSGSGVASPLSDIRKAIQDAVRYPPLARKRRLEGTVVAGFDIGPDGMPLKIEVVKSSGYRLFDDEARRIIKRAAPFPSAGGRVEVPISFRLIEEER